MSQVHQTVNVHSTKAITEPALPKSTRGTKPMIPKRFLITGHAQKPGVNEAAQRLEQVIQAHGAAVEAIELSGTQPLHEHQADMAIVLGGDGAILRTAFQIGERQIPIVGINFGRLGFLAEFDASRMEEDIELILAGKFNVSRHVMLECQVFSRADGSSKQYRVLNEVAIQAGPPFQLIDLDLSIDGVQVARISGDGLIISTPIGSTAHNLAAGGPILAQDINAIVITPLAPHALGWRPVVESADRKIGITCPNPTEGTTLILDGYVQIPLSTLERFEVFKSSVDFQLVHFPSRGYYKTLIEKLHWTGTSRS